MRWRLLIYALAFTSLIFANTSLAQIPHVLSTSPTQNELNVAPSTIIYVTFDIDMDASTIDGSTFVVNARSTGRHFGTIGYNSEARTAFLDPAQDFEEGEVISVSLTADIRSSGGTPLENPYTWSFTIVAESGSGMFAQQVTYSCDGGPAMLHSSDLDGDGDMDLAATSYDSGDLSILFDDGEGVFSSPVNYSIGVDAHTLGIFASDLDGDGDIDLAIVDDFSGDVYIFLNNGDGSYGSPVAYQVFSGYVYGADLDGDGDIDLATSNPNVTILLNHGDGTFEEHGTYFFVYPPYRLAISDLDGDGDMDLALPILLESTIAIMLNNGDGTFGAPVNYAAGGGPECVYAADLDADGEVDLAVANDGSDNVSVFVNNGDGTYAPHVDYAVGDIPTSVFAPDIDGDGDLDLVAVNSNSNSVSVLMNNNDGTFTTAVSYPVGSSPHDVFASDFDGDGDLDLAVPNYASDDISVLMNIDNNPVPALSEWGIIILTLLFLAAASISLIKRKRVMTLRG